jgi:hypothetical protein
MITAILSSLFYFNRRALAFQLIGIGPLFLVLRLVVSLLCHILRLALSVLENITSFITMTKVCLIEFSGLMLLFAPYCNWSVHLYNTLGVLTPTCYF